MSMLRKLGLAALVVACCPWSFSQAGVYVGIGVPGPYYYRPYYRPWYYGGVYVAPPPVVVASPPVVVQQPAVAQPAYAPASPPAQAPAQAPAPAPAPLPPPEPVSTAATPSTPEVMPAVATGQVNLDTCMQQLRSGDEPTRTAALVSLGKLRAERAVGPMVKALNSDPSPKVREAAARGLGLIASPTALSALQYAAQADEDAEVRRSASFAADVIRGNFRR
jgi:hypothetical protein